ncbi:helix-turn-helix transcriptional regulator [Alicyclobacillus cycloheptanicus]|uniref:Transcriptional regulator with XRE-family HTH domain n=1 Tax=Alicyclobacillus cycloheptanicus TaxID=1457 RepID=A0ABT9XLM5_9BACL|nr:helix-turn-helix transcriptional regulator [Alicyclobacillus cycloheptanicus]MDQ0190621.1 transcriptional regulator with XRE-family HTH domain [Alicyclobacillus cycloheptanicus]WDM01822.1 helix-turn-helix transcriptional regulator [Alicyclobacillus cycloheptanicus]
MKHQSDDQLYLHLLGQRIRLAREQKGWSQESLSFACGLHRTYIGAVERGERNISFLNMKRIATALDLSLSELLDFEEK